MSGAVIAGKRLPRTKFCNGRQGCHPHSATGHIATVVHKAKKLLRTIRLIKFITNNYKNG